MKNSIFKTEIANRLKSVRKRKGLSLDATSKLTGVSKAMLGQIEREESSPTISTLWKIASGLGTSFSGFFASDPVLCSGERAFPDDSRMKVKTLFPYMTDSGMEMFEITLTGHHQQMSSPHGAGVIEHVVVTVGQLNVFFDNKWHHLNSGNSIRFYSDQPHGYHAITEITTFQNIICYPR
ncbi:helix-turn-helix domain-containing protein [Vibrio sp. MA40-2]|uniref:helix-turn-helix domain-containing protein n=1 Tax=Vibrio sp. MA40-2 TaxID=3391828 RepID=UPI0039A681D8